jgi:hypothetical protein
VVRRHAVALEDGIADGFAAASRKLLEKSKAAARVSAQREKARLALAQQSRQRSFIDWQRKPEEDQRRIATEEALEILPPKVSALFQDFEAAPDADKAAKTLEQLNAVFRHAQSTQDELGFACEEKKQNLFVTVNTARDELSELESAVTQVQDRMQSMQSGMDRSEAEIQTVRQQYEKHRATCAMNRMKYQEDLRSLTADTPLAEALRTEVVEKCKTAGGEAPLLVECTLPDGSILPSFKDPVLQAKVAQLGSAVERLLSSSLNYALHSTELLASGASFMQIVSKKRRSSNRRHGRRLSARKRAKQHQTSSNSSSNGSKSATLLQIDPQYCTASRVVECPLFVDTMDSFSGNLEDLVDALNVRQQNEESHCHSSIEEYNAVISRQKVQVDDASVTLASSVGEIASLTGLREQKRSQLKAFSQEADEKLRDCKDQLEDASDMMCSTRRLWRDLKKATSGGTFMGECEVGEWVQGQCSQECGIGGNQTLKRKLIKAEDPANCPPLELTLACNERPCPIDASMDQWSQWTGCSRACGSGTKTRRRAIVRQPQNGGMSAGETLQEEMCNQQPCDADCELGTWTAWSHCSTACRAGHKTRVREVVRPAVGTGRCPDATDSIRQQTTACNSTGPTDCGNFPPKCASDVDVMFVLDGSGSVGLDGFAAFKGFASAAAKRMQLLGEALPIAPLVLNRTEQATGQALIGAVSFGSFGGLLHELTAKRDTFTSKLNAASWPGLTFTDQGTNLAAALAITREEFERQERQGASRIVVVVSDGPPSSGRLASTEVDRLKESGVRMTFVNVGVGPGTRALEKWASSPKRENVIRAKSYKSLTGDDKVTELLANICPVLLSQ